MAESRNCKVKGCSGRALHELPEDEEKRRIWTAALNLEVQYAPKSKVMCTEHFQMLDCIDVSSSKGSLSTTSGGSLDEDEDPLKLKKKEKSLLPKQATSFLRSWLSQHVTYPYPTDVQKRQIAAQTNLSLKQVTNWFINARRRLLHPMVDAPNGISASAEPSAENVDAGKSPHQKNVGVRTNSRPRQKVPAKVLSPFQVKKKVDVDPLAIPESIIDLTGYIQPTTLICSSTLLGTPNVSVANGQNMGSPEFRLKGAAKRANSSSTILKSTTKTGLKVLLPTATSRTAKPRRPRKSSSTLSDFQRQPADDDSNYTQAAKIAKTYRPIRPKPMTSSANQDVNPSPTVTSSSERQSDGVSTSSAPWGSVSGEDLLDTLYEVLYLKPPKITEDKDGKPVPQETATLQKLSNGQGTSADGDAATGGTKAATTSLTTQTWWETKHRGTQTNNSIHTAVLSYEMYKFKAEWVVYHTGLVNFEQFTLVLNSLSPDAYNLKYKRSTCVKLLRVEDQLLLTLMKLRRAEADIGLAIIFGISKRTVANIVKTWLDFMYREWSALDIWPKQELTVKEVFGPTGLPPPEQPQRKFRKPLNPDAEERVTKLYRILNKNLTSHYMQISDCILFICCILCDFREGVITSRKS